MSRVIRINDERRGGVAALLASLGFLGAAHIGGTRSPSKLFLDPLGRARKPSKLIATRRVKFNYRGQNWKPGQQGARETARRQHQIQAGVISVGFVPSRRTGGIRKWKFA